MEFTINKHQKVTSHRLIRSLSDTPGLAQSSNARYRNGDMHYITNDVDHLWKSTEQFI